MRLPSRSRPRPSLSSRAEPSVGCPCSLERFPSSRSRYLVRWHVDTWRIKCEGLIDREMDRSTQRSIDQGSHREGPRIDLGVLLAWLGVSKQGTRQQTLTHPRGVNESLCAGSFLDRLGRIFFAHSATPPRRFERLDGPSISSLGELAWPPIGAASQIIVEVGDTLSSKPRTRRGAPRSKPPLVPVFVHSITKYTGSSTPVPRYTPCVSCNGSSSPGRIAAHASTASGSVETRDEVQIARWASAETPVASSPGSCSRGRPIAR